MELSSILSKVRGLVAKAEHPDTDPNEAQACREAADRMMLKYAVDQAMLRDSQPVTEQVKPGTIRVEVCEAGTPYEGMFVQLIAVVCEHTRTKCLLGNAQADPERVETYRRYGTPLRVTAKVYGFEADLKYFEILYTTLLLHMSNGIDPKFDPSKSDADNAYDLHTSGLNWLEIARAALRFGHEHGWDGDKATYHQHGGYWKRQYRKALRARSEEFIHHPARFTEQQRKTWRLNFAASYVATINRRLSLARAGRASGAELVLASSMQAITDMVNADAAGEAVSYDSDVEFNDRAWQAGNAHAHKADIGGNPLARRVSGEL